MENNNQNRGIHNYMGAAFTGLVGTMTTVDVLSGSYAAFPGAAAALGLAYETFNGAKKAAYNGIGHLTAAAGLVISTGINFAENDTEQVVFKLGIAGISALIPLSHSGYSQALKSWTHFRFYALGQTNAAEDLFTKESKNALSKVRSLSNRKNIEAALLYADEDTVVPLVGEYLIEKIGDWHESYEAFANLEYVNSFKAEMYALEGSKRRSDDFGNKAKSERELVDKSIAHRKNLQTLLHTLNKKGLEDYVKELSVVYPDL